MSISQFYLVKITLHVQALTEILFFFLSKEIHVCGNIEEFVFTKKEANGRWCIQSICYVDLSTDDMIIFVLKKKMKFDAFFHRTNYYFDKLASRQLLQIVTLHQQHHSTMKLCNAMSAEFHLSDLVFWCVVDL